MDIRAFVFNWPGAQHAVSLCERLVGLVPTFVINSDPAHYGRCSPAPWVHLDSESYFAAQWNIAVELFDGDVLFHVQADAVLEYPGFIIERALAAYRLRPWGVFAPNVDYTAHTGCGESIGEGLYEVSATDCTCWFVHRTVLSTLPWPFPGTYGWGVDALAARASRALGRPVLRDYAVTVGHPRRRGYSSEKAMLEYARIMKTYLR